MKTMRVGMIVGVAKMKTIKVEQVNVIRENGRMKKTIQNMLNHEGHRAGEKATKKNSFRIEFPQRLNIMQE
jgi:BRCT domain type II-containing protein